MFLKIPAKTNQVFPYHLGHLEGHRENIKGMSGKERDAVQKPQMNTLKYVFSSVGGLLSAIGMVK